MRCGLEQTDIPTVVEQYKVLVQSADNEKSHSHRITTGFLLIEGAIFTVYGLGHTPLGVNTNIVALLMPFIGIAVSVAWWAQLYLANQRYWAIRQVVEEMEKHLPTAPLTMLAKIGEKRSQSRQYRAAGFLADYRFWPWIFFMGHSLAGWFVAQAIIYVTEKGA